MEMDQKMEQLRYYVDELSKIGNINEYRQTNNKDFLEKWTFLRTLFNNILNSSSDEMIMAEAFELLDDLKDSNSSMTGFVDSLIEDFEKPDIKENSYDGSELYNKIELCISKLREMRFVDLDEMADIKWALDRCKNELIEHQNSFEPNIYSKLMNELNVAISELQIRVNIIEDLSESMNKTM